MNRDTENEPVRRGGAVSADVVVAELRSELDMGGYPRIRRSGRGVQAGRRCPRTVLARASAHICSSRVMKA